jgi:hypothetical protein
MHAPIARGREWLTPDEWLSKLAALDARRGGPPNIVAGTQRYVETMLAWLAKYEARYPRLVAAREAECVAAAADDRQREHEDQVTQLAIRIPHRLYRMVKSYAIERDLSMSAVTARAYRLFLAGRR